MGNVQSSLPWLFQSSFLPGRENKTSEWWNDKLIKKRTPNLIWDVVHVLHVSGINSGLLYHLIRLYNDVPVVEVYSFFLSDDARRGVEERGPECWEQPGRTINHAGEAMPEGQSSRASSVDGIADEGEVEGGGERTGLEHMWEGPQK